MSKTDLKISATETPDHHASLSLSLYPSAICRCLRVGVVVKKDFTPPGRGSEPAHTFLLPPVTPRSKIGFPDSARIRCLPPPDLRLSEDFRRMEGTSSGSGDAALPPPLAKWRNDFSRAFQYYLDRSTPHTLWRWMGTLAVAMVYVLRVYLVQGFYIVSYGLGIYLLNLLIGFLSPKVDPELEVLNDGPALPTRGSDEFKPFIRRLPEFKFWYAITKAFVVAFVMTFFSMFDVPVFWPILLCYWIVLFVLTMKRQILHMIKYKYVPFDIGKQSYAGKKPSSSRSSVRD